MATHIKFRQKSFSSLEKKLALGLSATGVGISATNLAVNRSRNKEARIHQKQQLDAMDKLTKSIQGLDNRLEKQPINSNPTVIYREPGKRRKSLFNIKFKG